MDLQPLEPTLPPLPADTTNIAGLRILVADDNSTNRHWLSLLLNSWGCHCSEAAGSFETLNILKTAQEKGEPHTIAIINMHMKGMDGETLGAKIKQEPALNKTLLVMTTAIGRRGDTKRLKEIGFSAFLTKPVKQSLFRESLSAVLSGQSFKEQGIVTRHSIAESKHQRIHILVAEDNLVNQKVALGILGELGFRANAVNNGKEALKTLAKTLMTWC